MRNGEFRLKNSPWTMDVRDWPATPQTLKFLKNRIAWATENPDESYMPLDMVEGLLNVAEKINRKVKKGVPTKPSSVVSNAFLRLNNPYYDFSTQPKGGDNHLVVAPVCLERLRRSFAEQSRSR